VSLLNFFHKHNC